MLCVFAPSKSWSLHLNSCFSLARSVGKYLVWASCRLVEWLNEDAGILIPSFHYCRTSCWTTTATTLGSQYRPSGFDLLSENSCLLPALLSNNDPRHEQFVAQGEITKVVVLQTAAMLEEAIEGDLKAKFKPVAFFAFSLSSGAKFSDHSF